MVHHRYGKLRVRVLKVRRPGSNALAGTHTVSEFSVTTRLYSSAMAPCFTNEDNSQVVATDTQKNNVYIVAKRSDASSPEQFGLDLARHFLTRYPQLDGVRMEVQETPWARASIDGTPHEHSFVRTSPESASAVVNMRRDAMDSPEVVSQIRGMVVLKTTQSGWDNFYQEPASQGPSYTVLPGTNERCLSTELSVDWSYDNLPEPRDFNDVRTQVRRKLNYGLFGPPIGGVYSTSVQASIYDMGCVVLSAVPQIADLTINAPNIHYLPFKALNQMGERFEDDIFTPTSDPSGTIEMTVARTADGSFAVKGGPVAQGCSADTQKVAQLKTEVREALISKKANACPMASRLAWHASGTFDKRDGSGGSNGATMRYEPEMSDDANKGLGIIRDLLHPIKLRHPEVSYADLWVVASCSAIEFLGGPSIPVALGRSDHPDARKCPANGRLPDAHLGAAHLREVFGRMGFGDREIVALSGAHTMGRCHKVRSGYDGPWTSNPLKFDNEYFRNLMNLEWKPRNWPGELQYEDPSGEFMMLPTDLALKTDPSFSKYARMYADDQELFFKDFAQAYCKLVHLGCGNKPPLALGHAGPTASPPAAQKQGGTCPNASREFREHAMHGSLERMKQHRPRADVHSCDEGSLRTALHKAAFWGHVHIIKYLVEECHLDPNVVDSNGDTALHDATRFGHTDIVKILTPVTDLSIKNNEGLDPVGLAQMMSKPDIAAILRSKGSPAPAKQVHCPLTTHVLNTTTGKPADGVEVLLERSCGSERWAKVANGVTNSDGRIMDLLTGKVLEGFRPGVYRLSFGVKKYFAPEQCFYPDVKVEFEIVNASQKHHVPLLISPYGFSTYRGS